MKGRREEGRSVPSVTISKRKEGKTKEPVTSVTILMQPMAIAYMKLNNYAGSKGHPLLIYRTRHEPMPMSWIQGLPGAPPLDPWLHPNISVGCATSQYSCWLRYIPVFVLAALHPSIHVGCATSQYLCWLRYIPVLVLAALHPSISVGCATPQY